MPAKIKDETGNRYGRLLVLERLPHKKGKERIRWRCRCDCGKKTIVIGELLRNGKTKSCGCLHRETVHRGPKKDETGNRYGRLLVLKEAPTPTGDRTTHWWCRCDCGQQKKIRGVLLRNGSTKSCGCLHKELLSRARKKEEQGHRYGKWLVLKEAPKDTEGRIRWLCRCDCGTEKAVHGDRLRRGRYTSCGCGREETKRNMMTDERGNRYGRWLVIDEAPRGPDGRIRWLCRCDCGTEKAMNVSDLRQGKSKSCGCARKRINTGWHQPKNAREKISRTHTIDETGHKYGHLRVVKKSRRRINGQVCWRCLCKCGKYVTVSGDALRNGRATSCGCREKKGIK
jgi:hypothetical protein